MYFNAASRNFLSNLFGLQNNSRSNNSGFSASNRFGSNSGFDMFSMFMNMFGASNSGNGIYGNWDRSIRSHKSHKTTSTSNTTETKTEAPPEKSEAAKRLDVWFTDFGLDAGALERLTSKTHTKEEKAKLQTYFYGGPLADNTSGVGQRRVLSGPLKGIMNGGNGSRNGGTYIKNAELKDHFYDYKRADVKELSELFGGNVKSVIRQNAMSLNAAKSNPQVFVMAPGLIGNAKRLLDIAKEIDPQICEKMSSPSYSSSASVDPDACKAYNMAKALWCLATKQSSPIVLDLSGNDKVDLTSAKNGVQFDIDGDGIKDQVAWTKRNSEDGWLVLPNADNKIVDGTQLFGNNTLAADGNTADNGFDALKQYDDNADGKIDSTDSIYSKLRIWVDKNHNGISEDGELKTLDSKDVASISLDYTESDEIDANGNSLKQQSTFTLTNGKVRKAIDAWLNTSS